MTKHGKLLPARRQRDRSRDEDSILLRSAESLGRVIGTLQRQLNGTTVRVSEAADDVMEHPPSGKDGNGAPSSAKPSRKAAPKARKTAGASKADGTPRTSARRPKHGAKTTARSKTARARKTTGRR